MYEFVTAGSHSALERATALEGERVVVVMGGADLGRHFGQAGTRRPPTTDPVPNP